MLAVGRSRSEDWGRRHGDQCKMARLLGTNIELFIVGLQSPMYM